jgi:serine phosphatase RsbU (regulator of sigma subunit)
LDKQVAIIGVTAVGVADIAPTPIHPRTDGVEIHAQFIENILAGTRLQRPGAALWWEVLALMGIALPTIVFSRRRRYAAGIFIGATFLLFASSVFLFKFDRVLYDPTFPAIGSALTFLSLLLAQFVLSERRRHELDAALEEQRIERLRVAGELRAARDIQMGMLPNPRNIEGLPDTIDFFALLEPAQEVGGDLYDAFMIDARRLCFMIGDVSGKGVPASLFMALTKTLSKSLARRQEMPLERVIRMINEEVSRENPASMFVTTIIGIIDTGSGAVELCNAGHHPPIRLSPSAPPAELEGAAGPPLCVDEEFPYTTQRIHLGCGDMLILLTDGVTEAADEQQNCYGTARAIACFRAMPADAPSACAQLHADVKRFTGGAPQSDDLAILAIRRRSEV